MADTPDTELLAQFVRDNSDAAFAALVRRHVNLVYSVALRQTSRSHAAEEITQAVFIVLARKASSLGNKTVLPGWLYHTARLTAANFQRSEVRRFRREQEAFMQSTLNEPSSDPLWHELSPLLDDAMARLNASDRDALVLRYFQNHSLAEVGAAMGIEERAAQKRVLRALEKLRAIFAKRGVAVTGALIAGAVSANSVQAAPAALAATASATVATGAVVANSVTTLANGTLKVMSSSLAKVGVAGLFSALLSPVLSGAGSYYVVRAVAKRARSEKERAARVRLGWRIGISNVILAAAGIPLALINPSVHPRLFVGGIVLLLVVLPIGVGLQIMWSFRCKKELQEIKSEQTLPGTVVSAKGKP